MTVEQNILKDFELKKDQIKARLDNQQHSFNSVVTASTVNYELMAPNYGKPYFIHYDAPSKSFTEIRYEYWDRKSEDTKEVTIFLPIVVEFECVKMSEGNE